MCRCVQNILFVLFFAVGGVSSALADEYRIRDEEGFSKPLVAKIATIPKNWSASGRVVWNKPCSSNDLFETIFLTQSPDGTAGARIMPGYQFLKDTAVLTPGYPYDPFLQLMISQSEAFNQELATKFRGSNCGVGKLQGTENILRTLILRNRPADVRVIGASPDQTGLDNMRMVFGTGMPGVRVSYDAQIIDLSYTTDGVAITERLFLSWYSFEQEPIDLGGVSVSNTHTVVEPLRLVWAPTTSANSLLPKITKIFGAIRTNPEWQSKVDAVYKRLAEQRKKERKAREAEGDRRHKEFIEMITEGGASVSAESSGSGGPNDDPAPSIQTDDDKDFWGEPKPETDFWGEPKEETDYWGEPIEND